MKNSKTETGYAFAFGGGLFTFIGLGMLLWQLHSAYWPTTHGTLLTAEVAEVATEDGTGYTPKALYTFTLGDQTYKGDNYSRVQMSSDDRAQEQVKVNTLWQQQRSQGYITVHYSPTDPSDSLLDVSIFPFSFVFLTFGLVFVFVGLGLISVSTRRQIIFSALAAGSGLGGVVPGFVALMADWSLTWWIGAIWVISLVVAYLCALRHPDYVHAGQMAALAPKTFTSHVKKPPAAQGLNVTTPAAMVTGGLFDLARSFGKLSEADRRRIVLISIGAGLVPILFFGAFSVLAAYQTAFPDIISIIFFSSFGLFSGLLVGVATFFLVPLIANFMGTASKAINTTYSEFAQRVDGLLVNSQEHFLGLSWSSPEAITFNYGVSNVRLDIERQKSGEDTTHFTRMTFQQSRSPLPFHLHVYPRGWIVTHLSRQDVKLGWQVFDDQFVVRTDDEIKAKCTLTFGLQQELLRLKQWLRECSGTSDTSHIELQIEQSAVQVRVQKFFVDVDQLMTFYDFSRRIYDAVR